MSQGYEALRHGAAWMDLSARGRITARGRDRALLHTITTNEIKKMTPGIAATPSCSTRRTNPGRSQPTMPGRPLPDRHRARPAREGAPAHPPLHHRRPGGTRRHHRRNRVHRRGRSGGRGMPHPAGDSIAPFTVTGQPGYRIYCAAPGRLKSSGNSRPPAPSLHLRRTPGSSASRTESRFTASTSATPPSPRKPKELTPSASPRDATSARRSWSGCARRATSTKAGARGTRSRRTGGTRHQAHRQRGRSRRNHVVGVLARRRQGGWPGYRTHAVCRAGHGAGRGQSGVVTTCPRRVSQFVRAVIC